MTVMVVENNEHLLQIYTQSLEENGFKVISLTSGKEAIDRVKKVRPNVIVLDTIPKDMEGLQVLDEIKSYDSTIPVILNLFYKNYDMDSRSELADDYIVKSTDLSEFIDKVKHYVSGLNNNIGQSENSEFKNTQ